MNILRAWPVAVILLLAACSGDTTEIDPATRTALHQKSLSLLQEMAKTGAEHKGDCAAVATAWQQIYDANQGTFTQLSEAANAINTYQTGLTGDKKEAFKKNFEEPVAEAMETLEPIVVSCSDNAQIMALLGKMAPGDG